MKLLGHMRFGLENLTPTHGRGQANTGCHLLEWMAGLGSGNVWQRDKYCMGLQVIGGWGDLCLEWHGT